MLTVVSRNAAITALSVFALSAAIAATPPTASQPAKRTMSDIIAASQPSDWRRLEPENTLYLELPAGRVIIELAPAFAPKHAVNLRALVRAKFFDGLAVTRVQDNFVTQWGDAESQKPVASAARALPAEFTRAITGDLPFTLLPDRDGYAPEVGFSNGMPTARDPRSQRAWLVHCYGMVGIGRDNSPDSGSGMELYAVIGHSPRQLDRNITLVGRVVRGMDLLASLPRGGPNMGFYDKPEQRTVIRSMRVAADLPVTERVAIEALRTDTATFTALIEARRNRVDAWYLVKAGHIDLCNVPLPVRDAPADSAARRP